MKRILALCLLCGLAMPLLAQTPTVVEKVVSPVKNANAAKEAQVNAALGKSAPSNVKVVAVPAAKPSAVVAKAPAKPVINVRPAAKPAVVAVQAKPAAAQKSSLPQAKPVAVQAKPTAPLPVVAAKAAPQATKTAIAAKTPAPAKGSDPFSKKKPESKVKAVAGKGGAANPVVVAKSVPKNGTVVAVKENKPAEEKKPEPKKFNAAGMRDPFVSPVVNMGAIGSGCSTGKRCLTIDQIALRGVVKSENGMIAVVVNSTAKAYFLRENDPVFNGYVTKITSDSIIFKETFHDKLGKELTRDVTKTISRPAA